MTMQQKMWMWHTFTHIVSIIGLYFIIKNEYWSYLLIALVMSFLCEVSANISLHRYLAHKSFKTGKKRDIFLKYITIWSGLGPSIMWIMAHRFHHAKSDTEEDFQNPRIVGKIKSWFTIYPIFTIPMKYASGMLNCKHNKFIYRNYFKIQFVIYLLVCLINPYMVVILLTIPSVVCFHGAAAIGVLTHLYGYRVCESNDMTTNNILASIMSSGEGWHNYHHAYPSDYRHGYLWWELDPPAFFIEKFFKIG